MLWTLPKTEKKISWKGGGDGTKFWIYVAFPLSIPPFEGHVNKTLGNTNFTTTCNGGTKLPAVKKKLIVVTYKFCSSKI